MDPNQEIDDLGEAADVFDIAEEMSVDDFIKELEAKEKDLHITAADSVVEFEDSFDDSNPAFDEPVAEIERNGSAPPAPDAAVPPARDEDETSDQIESLKAEIDILAKTNLELRSKVRELEAERVETFKDTQRRAKDFENFKTRTERERKDTFQTQVSSLATMMLPALDNLHRALEFGSEIPEGDNGVRQFFDGIVIVNQQVNDVLASMGIMPIATVGEQFDPNFHEAVAAEASEEFPKNVISGEVLRGFRIGDRVVRHSLVAVSTGSATAEPSETEDLPAAVVETEGPVETEPDIFEQDPSEADDPGDFEIERNGE